jgi:hypothetical protein
MDPRDRPSDVGAGVECAACGRAVPPDSVRVLATRDDLLFAEGLCVPCGSVSLAILVAPPGVPANECTGPSETADDGRPADAGAIETADVVAMHELLSGWTGDLHSLLRPPEPRPRPESA